MPYYWQEKTLAESFTYPATGTVISVERNLFGNAQRPNSDEEKSCTLAYQYPFEQASYQGRYRHTCADFSGLTAGAGIELLLQADLPTNSKPAAIKLSYTWLKMGTIAGLLFLLLGMTGIAVRMFSKPQ